MQTTLTRDAKISVPLVCGAMYPCSNPELVAAVSQAGGIGIVQPLSLVYVHGYEFAAGLAYIRTLTQKPIGLNVIIEQSSKVYQRRMEHYVDVALAHGVRFFVTSLGNPRWVVERVRGVGGIVYHDVTEKKWAAKAADAGVHGLIAVNKRAGGHAGQQDSARLLTELATFGLPVLCAGGVGGVDDFTTAMAQGYAGVQMGTRFIATPECRAHADYKAAIVMAKEDDIVLTDRISGVPVAVINTAYVQQVGTRSGPVARWMLRGRKTKHWMRSIYAMMALYKLKRGLMRKLSSKDYWQAGRSVAAIDAIEPAADIVRRFAAGLPADP
jgi:nitronate monooxygenase